MSLSVSGRTCSRRPLPIFCRAVIAAVSDVFAADFAAFGYARELPG
ncbi:MAG TPA: hypothetical protein VM755_04820 [Stellaceae bacterium]|nr:hypothetical protein [Stellaceae bacterium]